VPIYGLTINEISQSKVPTAATSLQSPHSPHAYPTHEVCPFSSQHSFGYPTSLPGLQQKIRSGSLRALQLMPSAPGNNFQKTLT
jgi:hypothetical protein